MTNGDGLEETTKKFDLFKENQAKFTSKHQSSIEFLPHQFNKERKLPDWLTIFLSFHKSSLYKIENEVRYLKTVNKLSKSFTLNQKLERTCYEKLIIIDRNLEEKENRREDIPQPLVVIEKIIVGYRRPSKLKQKLQEGLNQIGCFHTRVVDTPISKSFQ